ncbi:hypothetical protein DFH06DRAFT_1342622 [Mycena polygramma]|nr:hypothetical protein DFH06DRAFT_1342622 [Mycena polygramma]
MNGRFRIDRSIDDVLLSSPTAGPTDCDNYFTFRVQEPEQEPLPPPPGSFLADTASEKYQLAWLSWKDFEKWLAEEQRRKGIELHLVKTYTGLPEFERQLRYVCSRGGTGGVKAYIKAYLA